MGWRTDQPFHRRAPRKLVLLPSSLKNEQMFLSVDEVFAVMRGEIDVMDTHPHSDGVHQELREVYSVLGNGKNIYQSFYSVR